VLAVSRAVGVGRHRMRRIVFLLAEQLSIGPLLELDDIRLAELCGDLDHLLGDLHVALVIAADLAHHHRWVERNSGRTLGAKLAAVAIRISHDVILVEDLTPLDLGDAKRGVAGVEKTMLATAGNDDCRVRGKHPRLTIEHDRRLPFQYEPVLAAMLMALQAERLAWVHRDDLDDLLGTLVDDLVRAPGLFHDLA
jgi:hypothetical protein